MSMTLSESLDLCALTRRAEERAQILNDWTSCNRCALSRYRKMVVRGEGPPNAKIFFLGQGPGETEDRTGRPFVGAAGRVLNNLLRVVGLRREEVYITNCVCCWPFNDREPRSDEISACWPRLRKEIYLVDPIILVPLGNTATRTLIPKAPGISDAAGLYFTYGLRGRTEDTIVEYPVMPLPHPSNLARNMNLDRGGLIHRTAQILWDITQLADTLTLDYYGTPIPKRKERP